MTRVLAAPDRTPSPSRAWRGLAATAVSALLVTALAACGDASGSDEPTAQDSSSTSTSPSASESASASTSATPTESATPSDTTAPDPVPSPIINKGVKAALKAGFPALVPAGVPAGWTVTSAAYSQQMGGAWQIELTDPNGAPVRLVQTTQKLADLLTIVLGRAPKSSGPVDVSGSGPWQLYEAGAEGTALGIRIAGTSAVLVGDDQASLVEIAEQLLTAEDGGSGMGDG